MKTTIIVIIIIGLLLLSWYGKKWIIILTTSNYHNMLAALYSNTIPLLKAEEISNINDYIILDTRTEAEYKTSHLAKAIWVNYPNSNLEFAKKTSKNQAILVYCSVGYRSEKVAESLQKMGFKKVYNLYGGLFEWTNKNFPIVDSTNKAATKIHGYSPSWGKWINNKSAIVYQ